MSGRGIAALSTNQKTDPAGAPFVPGSADNGLSVDAVSGRIVLGNDSGTGPGGSAALLSDREIDSGSFLLRFLGMGAATEIAAGYVAITDTASNNPRVFFNAYAMGENAGDFYIDRQSTGDVLFRIFNTTDNVRIGTPAVDLQYKLQVDGLIGSVTAQALLSFGTVNAGQSADITIPFPGAVELDTVTVGVGFAAQVADTCVTAFVSAADTVTVRFNNYSTGNIAVPDETYRVQVFKTV